MSKRLKILYVTASGRVGGAERCLLQMVAGLDPEHYQAEVLVGSEGPLLAMLRDQGTAAALLPLPASLRRLSRYHGSAAAGLGGLRAVPAYVASLRREIATRNPAIVHSNSTKMHLLAALARPAPEHPLIWHLHDFPVRRRRLSETASNRLLGWLSGSVRLAVANSAAVAQAWAATLPRLAGRIAVVHNGVDVEHFQAARDAGLALRQRWGVGPEALLAGMVAIFAPWKGQEIFLRAARQVLESEPQARFVLAGDDIYDTHGHGERRRQLEALARELGLGDAAVFTGFLEDPAPAYAALDVMIHASTEPEPFGRSIIEAMAAGTPVIASHGGGVAEILESGVNGLITAPGDAPALAQAMLQLRRHPDLRRRLATAGLERVRQAFSAEVVGRQLEAVYAQARNLSLPVGKAAAGGAQA